MGGICGSHFFTLETGAERGRGNLVWWGRLRWFGTAPFPSSLVFSSTTPRTRTLKREKKNLKRERKTRKDRKQIFIGEGKLVVSYSGWGGAGHIVTKLDPTPNPILVFFKNLNSSHPRFLYSHTHSNRGGAGRVTRKTCEIAIPK